MTRLLLIPLRHDEEEDKDDSMMVMIALMMARDGWHDECEWHWHNLCRCCFTVLGNEVFCAQYAVTALEYRLHEDVGYPDCQPC